MGGTIRPVDPREDRLYFLMMRDSARAGHRPDKGDDDDFYIEHPLGRYAERHYRYRSGDTLIIRLQDGRALRVAELIVLPRRNDPQTVRGTLWIETGSAAVVRAAFSLARKVDIMRDLTVMDDDDVHTTSRVPFINPLEFDLSLLTIEYALWDMTHWLPRTMRIEGMVRAGVILAPATFEITYRMLDVVTDRDNVPETEDELIARTLAEWRTGGNDTISVQQHRGGRTRVVAPRDPQLLLESEYLPPPIWQDAPGFITAHELHEIRDRLSRIPPPARPELPVRWGWGWGEPGMLRYNRVEALSVGARVIVPLPHVTVEGIARLGAGDLHPNAELFVRRETLRGSLEFSAYHRLATIDESRRALGAGNSLSALLRGRDEGEYFRATGAAVTVAPPAHRRRTWELRLYAEAHDDVARTTHIALPRLWHDSIFRENIAVYETRQIGTAVHYRPWLGTDPMAAQFGIDIMLQGELVDFLDPHNTAWYDIPADHVLRGRITLRGAVPLGAGFRAGAEAAAGAARGSRTHAELAPVPPQRRFYLGGAATLRGYEPGTLRGDEMVRGRIEIARGLPFAGLAIFGDYAATRDSSGTHQLMAAGTGISILDGLIRIDLAHAIGGRTGSQAMAAARAWRLELHLDAVL
jgi:hypothetical protein